MYIYTHISQTVGLGRPAAARGLVVPAAVHVQLQQREAPGPRRELQLAVLRDGLGRHYLSNATATCLIQASSISCIVYTVKDHHNLLHSSPLLKKTYIRQVVLDKLFPLMAGRPPSSSRIGVAASRFV